MEIGKKWFLYISIILGLIYPERCQQIESTKHLLWGCSESRNIWELFNTWITNNNNLISDRINEYEDIYKVISNILEKKITKEHLTNYLKHSYKIYKL